MPTLATCWRWRSRSMRRPRRLRVIERSPSSARRRQANCCRASRRKKRACLIGAARCAITRFFAGAKVAPYAATTKVPVEQTRAEIERTLSRYGAQRFAYFTEKGRAIIVFEANERRLRFDLPLPEGNKDSDAQKRRQKWRALGLAIKSKLEGVQSGIETFEEAFLAHVVMPDGETVGHHARPRIESA